MMSTYQQTVDDIRAFISSTDRRNSEELRALAAEYAGLCMAANQRLRKCADYLQKGLRSECIHLSDETPNLLDLVAALDLPESQEWADICFQYELPHAQPLLLELAAAVNEAYAEAQPLEALLAHHRLLALAHAPMAKRLEVVRRLAKADPSGPFWEEDARAYERSRMEEIRAAVPQMARAGNAAGIRQLHDELESPEWREAVHPELRRAVRETAMRLRMVGAEADLRKLLPLLHDAYGAMDHDETKRLLGQWLAIATAAQIAVPADLQEQVAPISDWVAQQDRLRQFEAAFNEACNRLQQGIDTGAPAVDLEKLHESALQFGRDIPDRLRDRYVHRIATLEAASRHRRIAIYSGIAAGFVLIAAIGVFVAYQSIRTREARDTVAALHQAQADVEQGSADRGEQLAKQVLEQHTRIASNPLVVRATADFNQSLAVERQRASEFGERIKAATDAGVEHPESASLERARTLAKTKVERDMVVQLREKIDDFNRSQQHERDSKFSADASGLAADINQVLGPALLKEQPEKYQARLQEYARRQNELASAHASVSPDLLKTQMDSVSALLKQKQAALDAVSLEQSLLTALASATAAEPRAAALRNFIAKCPASARLPEFQQVTQMADAEQSLDEWDRLLVGWSGGAVPPTNQLAETRLGQLRDYVAKYPAATFQMSKKVSDYVEYLDIGLKVSGDDGPWKGSFAKLLKNPLIHDLEYVETTRGSRYYVLPNTSITHQEIGSQVVGYRFQAILSPDLRNVKTFDLKGELLKAETASKSPQAVFSTVAAERISALAFPRWETTGTGIVADLLAVGDMNLVLKGLLLQEALSGVQPAADWVAEANVQQVQKRLTELNLDGVNWLDPRQAPPAAIVNSIQQQINALTPMRSIEQKIQKKREAIFAALPGRLVRQGVVIKGGNPIRMRSIGLVTGDAGATAFALDSNRSLVPVAHLGNGVWHPDESQLKNVPDGALVFVGGPLK